MSWVLLLALTGFAAFAALAVTLRAEPEGRAETGVVWTLVFYALICGPVLALGHANLLRPALLAIASLITSAIAFAASAPRRDLAAHAIEVRRAALAMARVPLDALRLAYEKKSFALLGLAAALATIVGTAWLTYLAPSESWDGFFYHEPIVGFAIQDHGFRVQSLPDNMVVQCANGYPRLCQSFALWFVIFTDKSLIELGNTLAAPGLMLVTFVIARRYCDDPVPLLGWSSALLLMPAMLTQTRTSMIDLQVAFFIIAAVHYATRPVLRTPDVIVSSLCMILIAGSKSTSLSLVPPLALVTYGRALSTQRRGHLGPTLAIVAAGSALIAATAAMTFVRNWIAFHNPLWPVSYTNHALHIDWKGLATLDELTHARPFLEMVRTKYHRPTGGVADIIARDYGYGVPWVVLPLACVSLVAAVLTAARRRVTKNPDAMTENLLLVALLGATFTIGSPTLTIARFNAQVVAVAMIAITWAAGRLGKGTGLHEGAIASTLIMTIVPMFWTDWLFGVDLPGIFALARRSPAERATMHFAPFQMPPEVARARERDLGPGDLLVFTQEMAFPGVLWNHSMSNRVEFVAFKTAEGFVAELEQRRPKWVVVGGNSEARTLLARRPTEWELVGLACRQDGTMAFRKK
jgi:hypothetical protein